MVDHVMKLLRAHLLGLRQYQTTPPIEIAGAGAHRHACGRRETHAGVDTFATVNRGQTCPISKVGQDHPAQLPPGAGHARQLFQRNE